MNKECRQLEALLSEYTDGSTSVGEAARIEAHLAGCARCRETLRDLRRLKAALANLPPLRPPAGLKMRIQEQAGAAGLITKQPRYRLRPTAGWVLAAAACLLLAILLVTGLGPATAPLTDSSAEMKDIFHDLRNAETLYLNAIDRMDQLAALKMNEMPPQIRQTFETNLALINQTLAESRTYVLENANNPRAWEHLLAAYQKKVEFLSLIIETDLS
ncbi:MAG: zf-HC2 domain-containing protein [Acidobacteria bacterium]|nr:zf-HC2 domain-containing protein [Acidobacteriota bacterium]